MSEASHGPERNTLAAAESDATHAATASRQARCRLLDRRRPSQPGDSAGERQVRILRELIFAGGEKDVVHGYDEAARGIDGFQNCIQLGKEMSAELALCFFSLSGLLRRLASLFVRLLLGGFGLGAGLRFLRCHRLGLGA